MFETICKIIPTEMVAILYSECNGAELMKESLQEVERKTEMMKIYNSLKAGDLGKDCNRLTQNMEIIT